MCLFVAPAAAGAAAAGTATAAAGAAAAGAAAAGTAAAGTAATGIVVGSAAAAAALNSALVGLATTGISMVAQQQQARASNQMMRQRQEYGTRLAKENYAKQIEAAFTRTSQEREAAADEIAKISSEGRKAAALAALSAGERGVSGQGIDQIYADFESQELRYQTNLKRSLSFREQAIQNNLDQARRGMQTNIMNLQFMPRSGPNLLAGALQVGASAFDSYQRYKFYGPDPRSTPDNVG